jgi:crotonobetainyl-CoA:carnitine CoA-transferase CaiB-like acyl-CoA transferase
VYRCRDGRYVGLSGSTQTMAERILRTIGRPELVADPRFRDNASRVKHAQELDNIVGGFIAQYTQQEAVALFDNAQVTVGPIYDISQIVADPHFIEREIVAEYPDEEMGRVPMHHVVPRLCRTPGSVRSPAPALGAHNRDLLAEVGIDEPRYLELLASGALCEAAPAQAAAGR